MNDNHDSVRVRVTQKLQLGGLLGGALLLAAALAAPQQVATARLDTRAQVASPDTVVVSSWPTYHADAIANGDAPPGLDFSSLTHAWTSPNLNGEIYGEPLIEDGRVIVATEDDIVYALNAQNGGVLWARHVATAVASSELPCGDISPVVGITSTPVVDPSRGEVFVVADEAASGGASHHLVGLSLSTGAVELNQAIDPPGSQPLNQLQRPGLALDDGEVIVGFGGNDGDCAYYHGWVASVPETGGNAHYFEVDAANGDDQGAVWMGGASPDVDAQGNVWVSAGNGSVSNPSAPYDDSDSVLELSSTMHLEQYFAPSTWASDNGSDLDLGSSSPALLTDGLAVQIGKSGTAYLLRQSHLGGIGGQLTKASVCSGESLGGDATSGGDVFVPCSSGVLALAVGASPPSLRTLWTFGRSSGPPIIAGGLVWTESQSGELFGLNPQNGNPEVQLPGPGNTANHFPTPSAADGLLLAASANNLIAYRGPEGLPPGPTAGTQHGYRLAASDGGVFDFGGAPYRGSMGGRHLNAPIVGMATTPDGGGYWLVASDGGIFSFGDAHYHGSMGGRHLNEPVVGMAATSDGGGYWLVASDGGIFSFGDAHYHGSMGGRHLNEPVVGMAATSDGGGYWLVASDGGIFSFGDAHFEGSMGGRHLDAPVVGIASDPKSHGYWMVGADSGVFAFDAPYAGSLSGLAPGSHIVGIASTPTGLGYWLAADNGGVFTFGDAAYDGSMGSTRLVAPIVAVSHLVA
jgi:outer membrane protein assembly factor BamB